MAAPEVEALLLHGGDLPWFTYPEDYPYVYWTAAHEPLCAPCAGLMVRDEHLGGGPENYVASVNLYLEGPTLTCCRCQRAMRSRYGAAN